MSDVEPEQLNIETWLREQAGNDFTCETKLIEAANEIKSLRVVLAQYRDDLMYPPTGEQRERRITMVKKLLEAK